MGLLVNFAEPLHVDVGVDLGRRYARVTEELLHYPDIRPLPTRWVAKLCLKAWGVTERVEPERSA